MTAVFLRRFQIAFVATVVLTAVAAHGQGPLTNGGVHNGAISSAGEIDTWTLTAKAGTTIRVQIGVVGGTNFHPLLRLYDPAAAEVASNFGTNSTNVSYVAGATGTYTVRVSDSGNPPTGTGTYRLYLALSKGAFVVPAGDQGGTLTSGGRSDGTIDLGDMDMWSFEANALEAIRVQIGKASGAGFNPGLALYGPDGSLLTNNFGSTSTTLSYQASVAGTYTVVVADATTNAAGSGTYHLYFAKGAGAFIVPSGDEGGTLTSGGRSDGTIDLGDMDVWSFQANALEAIRVQIGKATGGFSPGLWLYGPDGSLLTNNFGSTSTTLSYQATVAGTYTVIVADTTTNAAGSGTYHLYFAKGAGTFIVPSGDEGGTLTSGGRSDGTIDLGDMDVWSFQANALEAIRVQIGKATGGFSPGLWLYGPDGSLLTNNFGSTSTTLSYQATVAGTYTVIVADTTTNAAGSGTYHLYFAKGAGAFIVPSGDEGGTLSNGGRSDGTIDLGDMDVWSFQANEFETIRIQIGKASGASFNPGLALYGPDGSLLTNNFGSTSTALSYQATVAGTYTVIVADTTTNAAGSGTYHLYFAKGAGTFIVPSGDEGGTLTSGVPKTGTIALGDIDSWSFQASAGDSVSASLQDTSNNSFTPFIVLYDPDGAVVISDFNSSVAQINATITVGGTYTIFVSDGNSNVTGSGNYQLNFSQIANGTSVPAGAVLGSISNGGFQDGNITPLGDLDKWTFSAQSGEIVWVQVGITGNTGLNPFLQVFAPNGTLVGASSGSSSAAVRFVANQSGTYVAAVREGQNNATGTYRIFLARAPEAFTVPAGDEGGALTNGDSHDATISLGDLDLWSFDAQPGDAIRVQVGATGNTGFNPHLIIYGPNGEVASSAGSSSASVAFSAPVAGTYTALVREAQTNASGTYRIYFARAPGSFIVPAGDEGGSLANGSNHDATISLGDLDLWSFDAQAGDRVWVQVGVTGNTGLNPELIVHGPDGGLMAENSGSDSAAIAFTAPTAGTYTTFVREAQTNASGSYRIHFASARGNYIVPSGDEGGAITNGSNHDATITLGDLDLWSFDATAGDQVWVQVGDTGDTGLNPHMLIYAPDGSLVASSLGSSSASIAFRAVNSGTYRALVREAQTNASGTYRLYLADIPEAYQVPASDEGGGLENGVTRNASITLGDLDLWSFNAEAGSVVTLQISGVSSGLDPAIYLYGPNGELIAFGSTSLTVELERTGLYFVVVREAQTNASGNYSLTATGINVPPLTLDIARIDAHTLMVSWPSPSTGYILEESQTLQPNSWQQGPTPMDDGFMKYITVDLSTAPPRLFFRLRHP